MISKSLKRTLGMTLVCAALTSASPVHVNTLPSSSTPPALVAPADIVNEGALCSCGAQKGVTVRVDEEKWTYLGDAGRSGVVTIRAGGNAWYGKKSRKWYKRFFNFAVNKAISGGIKAASAALFSTSCPMCHDIVSILPAPRVNFLGKDKQSDAYGDDPGKSGIRGSKKCGGLLVNEGGVSGSYKDCPCEINGIDHLVESKSRFSEKYRKRHSMMFAGTAYRWKGSVHVMPWDGSGKYGDNAGAHWVLASIKP